MENSIQCSALQCSERSANESQVSKKYSQQEIRNLLNLIKVLRGRSLFLKLKPLEGTGLLELTENEFPGENINYVEGISNILNYLFKHHIMLNEVHSEQLYEFCEKFPITKNISHPILECKKKILDYSLKITDEIQCEKDFIAHLIKSNRRWCSLEREFNESLNKNLHQTQDTNSWEQATIQAKKMKKISSTKVGYEILWGIMSIHSIDYQEEEEFLNIFYRIRKAQNLQLQNINQLIN